MAGVDGGGAGLGVGATKRGAADESGGADGEAAGGGGGITSVQFEGSGSHRTLSISMSNPFAVVTDDDNDDAPGRGVLHSKSQIGGG
jgi:hypothetical protein